MDDDKFHRNLFVISSFYSETRQKNRFSILSFQTFKYSLIGLQYSDRHQSHIPFFYILWCIVMFFCLKQTFIAISKRNCHINLTQLLVSIRGNLCCKSTIWFCLRQKRKLTYRKIIK